MTDYMKLAILDQRGLEIERAVRTVRGIHDSKSDGPDKIAMEITLKVLEAELQSIKDESERLLSARSRHPSLQTSYLCSLYRNENMFVCVL